MAQPITIKLSSAGPNVGPFTVYDDKGNIVAQDITRAQLKAGITFYVDDDVKVIIIKSTGRVQMSKAYSVASFDRVEYGNLVFNNIGVGCVWKHLDNPLIYNTFYGNTEPYVIEYPFTYKGRDEILQNVQDYTKVYKYVDTEDGVFTEHAKYELDDAWFNKAIIYNGQQCSGLLKLEPKPKNSLKGYMSYPKFNEDSKTILYTKNDNIYQYNTFWSVTKDSTKTHFVKDCSSLSIDKQLNQTNMDYSIRSRKKDPFRAKEVKIRHIMDNRDDIHLVSQFIITPVQHSYK